MLDSRSEPGGLPTQMAVRNNHLNMVKLLSRSGADINTSDFDMTADRYGALYLEQLNAWYDYGSDNGRAKSR